MCNQSPHGTSFWSFLLSVDQDIADRARREACPCGGRLHCANFPRKPRGCPDGLPEGYSARLSFCCDRDGCRKRVTPPSVRFLGRKVYLAAIVVLTAAMRQGPTPRRVRELSRLVGADRATIFRWQGFWQEQFPRTPFWKVARASCLDDRRRRSSSLTPGCICPPRQSRRRLGKLAAFPRAIRDFRKPKKSRSRADRS